MPLVALQVNEPRSILLHSIFNRLKTYLSFLFVGFVGVYLAGYMLELTGSWSAVFNVTAVINLCGITVFALFGSGKPIV